MGLKSGSRDAGLDETNDEKQQSDRNTTQTTESNSADEQSDQKPIAQSEEPPADPSANSNSKSEQPDSRPTMDSIPYKLRRNKVNEGREQVPYFLREEVISAEDDLHDTLEEMLGETVYKSDYREAAMIVAQRNPEFVAEVLREWGYDLEI